MELEPGTLYVVATPIGNLGDISPRALAVLGAVDWIAAEDTRHSGRLLRHFGIATPLVSLHEHNERERVPRLLAELRAGKTGALISDAGTPLVSDPGFPLVRELRRQGMPVRAVPGPSSVLAALSIAGLPCERFAFEGFLPARSAARRERLRQLADSPWTLVLFEAGRRIRDTLADLAALFGAERPAFIGRELTKSFEESHTAALGELAGWLAARPERERGEFVLVVQGAPVRDPDREQSLRVLRPLLRELPLKQAVALAAELTGARRNMLYELALEEQHDHQ
jgi:16S rRNA (cytidine1402-2'-O)-methyltransferase